MTSRILMSYYGSRAFVCAFSEEGPNPGSIEFEIEDALRVSDGKVNRDSQVYHTLASDGWPSICLLGQEVESIQVDCLRAGTGDAYTGVSGSSTYTKLRYWHDQSKNELGAGAYKCIVVVQPRGGAAGTANEYQGTAYVCCPENWEEGDKGTDGAQLYNSTYKPLGKPIPVTVTHTAASGSTPESWSFSAESMPAATSITVNGSATATAGVAQQYTASVSPAGADGRVAWSVVAGTGQAAITGDGVLVGSSAGTVTVKATSVSDPSVNGTKSVTISAG